MIAIQGAREIAIPDKFVSFFLCLHAEIFNALGELDEWSIEEATTPPSLLKEVAHADPSFGIAVHQTPVARVHGWRNAFCLPSLITPHKISIEYFKDKSAEVVGVNSRQRVTFYLPPARLGQLGRGIASRIRYNTAVILDYRQLIEYSSSRVTLHILWHHHPSYCLALQSHRLSTRRFRLYISIRLSGHRVQKRPRR
jgi:hypothetical protein